MKFIVATLQEDPERVMAAFLEMSAEELDTLKGFIAESRGWVELKPRNPYNKP